MRASGMGGGRSRLDPFGADFGPAFGFGPFLDEGTLGAKSFDQAVFAQRVQGLADGRTGDAAFLRQFVHGGNLAADRPFAGLDTGPEQSRQLDVARDVATAEIQFGCARQEWLSVRQLAGISILLRRKEKPGAGTEGL